MQCECDSNQTNQSHGTHSFARWRVARVQVSTAASEIRNSNCLHAEPNHTHTHTGQANKPVLLNPHLTKLCSTSAYCNSVSEMLGYLLLKARRLHSHLMPSSLPQWPVVQCPCSPHSDRVVSFGKVAVLKGDWRCDVIASRILTIKVAA